LIVAVDLSFCIVNTNGREHLERCLDAIRDTLDPAIEAEILICDNASDDGSLDLALSWISANAELGPRARVMALERREGKAANDSMLLEHAEGEFCLLLNEDSELRPGCTDELLAALRADPGAAAAGAQLLGPDGNPSACAWRLPGLGTALAQAVFAHRRFVTQSGHGPQVREVGWVQSAAMLVRRNDAERVGYLDPEFFVYSDETDFCKRLHDSGKRILHVPGALAVHHEQLTTDRSAERRVVEFHRNRDLYMRKHHGTAAARAVRVLTAWSYAVRAAAAIVLPGHEAGWYWLHARKALRPSGEGLREAAAAFNHDLDAAQANPAAAGEAGAP
jgi:N-acetylglucosaminyl-diphospho-decaprenol L-rhamnosyltransferase